MILPSFRKFLQPIFGLAICLLVLPVLIQFHAGQEPHNITMTPVSQALNSDYSHFIPMDSKRIEQAIYKEVQMFFVRFS